MSDPTLSDNDFKNQMAWVWSPDSGLPFKATDLSILYLGVCGTEKGEWSR